MNFLQDTSHLLTLEQVTTELQKTEPLSSTIIGEGTKVSFNLGEEWAADLATVSGTTPVQAYVTIAGHEYQMSRDAILQAAAQFGLTAAYLKRAPAKLIEPHLNYWYAAGLGENVYTALRVGDVVQAVTTHKHIPFSNLDLLEKVLDYVGDDYDSDPLFDGKFQNTLVKTDIRAIFYETELSLGGDKWSRGLHISNSLVGKSMTRIDGYLYNRDWYAGTTFETEGSTWNRRLNGQEELDMLDWAKDQAHVTLLRALGFEAAVDSLAELPVTNITETLREVFESYKVPQKSRGTIIERVEKSAGDTFTMYSIMMAVLTAANVEDLPEAKRDVLMRIGGSIPTARFDPTKAKVFSEGQSNPKGPNPYVIPTAAS